MAAALLALATGAAAQDRADIDRTQIIGNKELPKVIYIVPWKKPLPGPLSGRPLKSVLDEPLAPLERDVFRREMNYQAQALAQRQAQAETAAPTTSLPNPPSRPTASNGVSR